MIDTHGHLHDPRYDGDRDATVARARAAGVTHMLAVGCDLADSNRAIDAAKRYGLSASIGIHPHEAKDAPADIPAAFAPLFGDAPIVAIGETGLDYYYAHSPHDAQAAVLRSQLRFARDRGLPLIFHQRDAYDDFVAILRAEFPPGTRGVVHCFTGNAEQARELTGNFGLTLGIGGVVTFANAGGLREAVRAVGLGSIVLETDCPYLAPVPVRGQRNEPAFLPHVASKLADVLGVEIDDVVSVTDRNAKELFGI
ncbi:MAG TPA: TatD family hydrolase [Candidatus Tumulicola sp.]